MGDSWPYALHAFYQTPAFTDDILVDWAKSVCEHGRLLQEKHKSGNWLIMEMNGLAQLSIFFPELKKSGEWLSFAFRIMEEELERQLYPDGFQYELSTNYHEVVLANYFRLIRVAQAYGISVPGTFLAALERALEVYVKLVQPDGRLPDLNDGSHAKAADFLASKLSFYPHRLDFRWAAGGEGEPPAYTSVALPYSGLMVMRSGWEKDAVWALFDAAPFGHGHQHEDKLSLLFFAHGKLLLTEGGNYAYDQSEMRQYVLSTRAHNTVRVDGKDQNRERDYHWQEEDIRRLSGMEYQVGEALDFARGTYDEGYGPECSKEVTHQRSVSFFKNGLFEGQKPFLVVVDRLFSQQMHEYEALWHLEGELAALSGGCAEVPGLRLLYSEAVTAEQVCGQTEPEWQGWIANSFNQGDFRPIHTLLCRAKGSDLRFVTVLDPFRQIDRVAASQAISDTSIRLQLVNGQIIVVNE